MPEGQLTRKIKEKLDKDYCLNVAEIYRKKINVYKFNDKTRANHDALNSWYHELQIEEIIVSRYVLNSV